MRASVSIVGGGISGICIAYYLTELGIKDVIVVEKGYLGSGSTFRCATGIRASFTTEEHIVLMKNSIEMWKELSESYGFYYLRGGYLWLLSRESDVEAFKKYVEFHHSLGVPTRLLSQDEIRNLVPGIRLSNVLASIYDPLAGKACPFEALHAIARECKKRGVKIYTQTEATRILIKNNRVIGIETSRGSIEAENVVIAAGYGTKSLMKTAGINIPLENVPHHALVTERFKETFKPLIIDWSTGAYIVQTKDGNFLMGTEIEEEPNIPPTVRIDFIPRIAKIWIQYLPWLREVRVLRYWTGYYVMSPDRHPIYGPVDEIEGLYIAAGYSGHGFMMGPITGKLIAEWIVDGKPSIPQAMRLTLRRIKEGKLIHELAVIG